MDNNGRIANGELDESLLEHVTAGHSSNNPRERAMVLVNNLLKQYMTGTLNESIVVSMAGQMGVDPKEVFALLEEEAQKYARKTR